VENFGSDYNTAWPFEVMHSHRVVCFTNSEHGGRNPDGSFLFPGYLISLFTLIRRIMETSSYLLFFGFVDSISFLTQFASSQNHLLKEKWGAGNPRNSFSNFRRVILWTYCRNSYCGIFISECDFFFCICSLYFIVLYVMPVSDVLKPVGNGVN
jgi:hypothetical protein